jgi:hypothetical protein
MMTASCSMRQPRAAPMVELPGIILVKNVPSLSEGNCTCEVYQTKACGVKMSSRQPTNSHAEATAQWLQEHGLRDARPVQVDFLVVTDAGEVLVVELDEIMHRVQRRPGPCRGRARRPG